MYVLRKVLVVVVAIALAFVVATPAAAQSIGGSLSGAQEVPPNGTPGTGFVCLTVNAAAGVLDYVVTYTGLVGVETAAHFHGPAGPGVNAPIIFPLPLGTPKIGSIGPLTLFQFAQLSAGQWYVNVHTDLYPGGEIRGQITSECGVVPVAPTTWGSIKALYR
jgi:hypothetical protein